MTNVGCGTTITVFAAGLVFLLALCLGIWKYRQMATNENHLAHPYVDTAHRAALLYSFATLLVAVFVELSAWATWLNLTAAMVLVFFFLFAIVAYIVHGIRCDTTNQFEDFDVPKHISMWLLIVGEIGGLQSCWPNSLQDNSSRRTRPKDQPR